ncbi:hypothetical protein PIB30_077540, partial [Stylosanthes scabra]|nr:hypothetical protein [Stylosanthes scabra]
MAKTSRVEREKKSSTHDTPQGDELNAKHREQLHLYVASKAWTYGGDGETVTRWVRRGRWQGTRRERRQGTQPTTTARGTQEKGENDGDGNWRGGVDDDGVE